MRLHRMEKIDDLSFSIQLKNELKLNYDQRQKIEQFLRDTGYHVYKTEKFKKPAPIYRLTGPFYTILYAILLITMPFKWLLTGNAYYRSEGRIGKLMRSWKEKLGL